MTLLTKLQRQFVAEGNYAAARALAEGKRPRKARKPIRLRKRRTAEEEREKFAREYGSDARVKWISAHRCLVCGVTPCVNAHTRHPSSGMGYKGDHVAIVPLCRAHEDEKHQHGEDTFNAKYARELVFRTLASWAETFANAWRRRSAEVAS